MASLEYIFFIIGAIFSLGIVLFRKRFFDFHSIFIFILFLYTIPLFFGFVNDPYTGNFVSPDSRTFLVMGIPYYISIVFLLRESDFSNNLIDVNSKKSSFLKYILVLSLFGFILYFPTILKSGTKVELLENSNMMLNIIYSTLPVFGFLASLKYKNKKLILIFSTILLIIFLFGARRSLALAIIGSMIIILNDKKFVFLKQYKMIAIGLSGMFLVLIGKVLYGYVLSNGVVQGVSAWKNDFTFDYLFTGSEFLTTSAILNSVIVNDFHTDKIHYFYSFLALQPIPLSYFGYSSSYFNDMFQPALFPGLYYGMAYNPWAEAYSAFGYLGVVFLSVLIFILLDLVWKLYCRSNSIWSFLFLMLGLYLAFWIQRNSLGSIFAYLRNIFYPLFFIILIYSFLVKLFKPRN